MRNALLVLSLIVWLCSHSALGCQFNTDCNPGSVCLKRGGLYGVCAGGLNPGNSNDNVPTYNPIRPMNRDGATCQFSYQCGPGGVCLKGSGIYGVCQ